MTYIGTVPPKVWDIAIHIARRDSVPIPQPEDSPYILLKQVNDKQLLILSGCFHKQAIDITISMICVPETKEKDIAPIQEIDREAAREDAMKLLAKAVEEHSNANKP